MTTTSVSAHAGLFSGLNAKFKAWRRYHHTMSELQALDQRELDDLGIGTSDFEDLAHGRNIADRRN
jgi:uncharacterized protein YjiS (DUF1127 family)